MIHDEDSIFIVFQANHNGIVQLRRRATDATSAGPNNASIYGDMLLFLALGAFMLHKTRRVSLRRL